ncbi:MAG TPA: MBL fold metallo-hydrolase [Baekduia sp.]|nr:MBL fold metallo-hydrolase [Baekduia sp.]
MRAAWCAVLLATVALAAPAAAHGPDGARGGDPVARAPDVRATVAARNRFFGEGNVDQATGAVRRDRVIFSWVGVTNFAAAIRGHVVLLDAWVPRGLNEHYVPVRPEELAALDPELILLGHAHFDHAADAVPIAQAADATIVGLGEHCAEMVRRASGLPPRCTPVIPAGAPTGTKRETELLPGVGVTVVKHLHSGAQEPDASDGYHVPVLPTGSLSPVTHPPSPEAMAHLVAHAPDAEGGSMLYRFQVGDTSFVWHDTSGPLKELAPGGFEVLRTLRPVDVQLGAIQSFNQFTNGMRDIRMYIEALRPALFVPDHHDDWAPGITNQGDSYREPLYAELARLPAEQRPQVRFLRDPMDYVRPEALTFPVRFAPLRLTRRCAGAGRLHVSLAGDTADVQEVRVRLGAARRTVGAAPWRTALSRRELARRGGRSLVAEVVSRGGERQVLKRRVPGCGVRRAR